MQVIAGKKYKPWIIGRDANIFNYCYKKRDEVEDRIPPGIILKKRRIAKKSAAAMYKCRRQTEYHEIYKYQH